MPYVQNNQYTRIRNIHIIQEFLWEYRKPENFGGEKIWRLTAKTGYFLLWRNLFWWKSWSMRVRRGQLSCVCARMRCNFLCLKLCTCAWWWDYVIMRSCKKKDGFNFVSLRTNRQPAKLKWPPNFSGLQYSKTHLFFCLTKHVYIKLLLKQLDRICLFFCLMVWTWSKPCLCEFVILFFKGGGH